MTDLYFRDAEEGIIEENSVEEEVIPSIQPVPFESPQRADNVIDEADDIDTRQLRRMQQRAQEKQELAASRSSKKRLGAAVLKSSKRQSLSASFFIKCGKEGGEETKKSLPKNYSWFACRVAIKGFI